jgi:hypothetical protein
VCAGVNIDRLRIVNEAFRHDAGIKRCWRLQPSTNGTQRKWFARYQRDEFGFIRRTGSIEDAARYGADDRLATTCS